MVARRRYLPVQTRLESREAFKHSWYMRLTLLGNLRRLPSAPGRRARIFGFGRPVWPFFFCLEQVNPFWATYLHVPDFEIL